MDIKIEPSWKRILQDEFAKDYFKQLTAEIKSDYVLNNPPIFPPAPWIFNAFTLCPFDKVRVVILGQDPYHGSGQAHGLSFSVQTGTRLPPSLKNIYKEIASDIGTEPPESGNLERWSKQGVLLLNSTLTVKQGQPGSHQGKGWEIFTDAVIKKISDEKEHVVFLLWGNFARSKATLINSRKHCILEAPHPSPFSAHSGFFGCKHFSQTNLYLKSHHLNTIDW